MPDISFDFNCSQKWGDLKSAGCAGQKFCDQCKKPVHDLSKKSHSEIVELLRQNNNHLCAYFYSEQLREEKKKNFLNPRLVLAGVAAWLTFSSLKVSAQQSNPVTTEQHDTPRQNTDDYKYGIVDDNPVCFLDEPHAVVTTTAKQPRSSSGDITLFRIGNKRVYLSKRFPLIHIGRRYRALGGISF